MIKEKISVDIIQSITTQQAWHYMILPFDGDKNFTKFYIADEQNSASIIEELEVLLGRKVDLTIVDKTVLRKEIARYYRKTEADNQIKKIATNSSTKSKEFLEDIILEAQQLGSSDIHFEPFENKARIRMRIDGKLIERYSLDKSDYPSLVNKIKIKANLDIAEKRLPQDGRIFFQHNASKKLDLRVSALPTLHGEKVVLRLLSNDAATIQLGQLGLAGSDLEHYIDGVKRPNGIVLISGPTGSGKTTTLYATLQLLNQSSTNIVTIEDPIEYTLEGINQVQLKENIGLDFPSAMRTFLRQDPDVIMVGEIRDKATASMAIRASLTGHLVLSTVHTNSAWGIIARLVDMGIPSYLIADTLNMAVAQRLLRLLCPDCKKRKTYDNKYFPKTYTPIRPIKNVYHPEGCENCFYTGYRGRRAIYEVIPIDTELSYLIKDENLRIGGLLKEKGIKSLSENVFSLLEQGLTSPEEVYPILASS